MLETLHFSFRKCNFFLEIIHLICHRALGHPPGFMTQHQTRCLFSVLKPTPLFSFVCLFLIDNHTKRVTVNTYVNGPKKKKKLNKSVRVSALPSVSHLQRRFGCSDTRWASCLHPQVKLSSIAPSLSRASLPRAPSSILRSPIFDWSKQNRERKSRGHRSHQVDVTAPRRTGE